MSCGYGTTGFQCQTVYTLGGRVSQERAQEMWDLGQSLGLTEFNPTSVDWDHPVTWKGAGGGIMTQAEGYSMLFGFGIALTCLTVLLTFIERVYSGTKATSEQFNTAGRDVKTGLTASVIVSQWTWAATLLQSSNVAWNYGITGPFWYASGATVQILLFGILAIEIKRRAPNAHTFAELVRVRWGTCAHFTFLFFGLSANLIVSAMLLLGGCAVFNAVAGIPIETSSFLIPLLTLVYTLVGGLKATFLASYFHTALIFVILILMVTIVYGYEFDCTDTTIPCNSLGSASLMWERLTFTNALPERIGTFEILNRLTNVTENVTGFHQGPTLPEGNRQGTYLTMMSAPGLSFGVINTVGNFGTVFCDQSYWQSAIAARPASAHKGYILGGMVWFTIPFALATSLGLAGNALNVALSSDEAGQGLVPPASAIAMMGPTGGILVTIQLTMAILSTGSAECIAVSSLWAYDIYRTYINPSASGKQILLQSRIVVALWALVMAISSIVLNSFDIGLGWVYCFMGVWIGSGVFPVACCVYTDRLNATFAILAAWLSWLLALITWVGVAVSLEGEVSKSSLGQLPAQLAGCMVSLLASMIICLVGCLVAPMHFDWTIMLKGITLVGGDGGEDSRVLGDEFESKPEFLEEAKRWIFKNGWGYTVFIALIWPLACVPLGSFGKSTFQLWGAIAMCWGWGCGLLIIILPVYESSGGILAMCGMGKKANREVKAEGVASAASVEVTEPVQTATA